MEMKLLSLASLSDPRLVVLPKTIMPTIATDNFKIEPTLIHMIERHQFSGEKGAHSVFHPVLLNNQAKECGCRADYRDAFLVISKWKGKAVG